ncbi:MAG: mechanosensitive ion channel family protein [Parcubacteria group bacterium]
MIQALSESFLLSMQSLWNNFLGFVPALIGAILVLIFGLIVSALLGKFAKKLVKLTRLDVMSEKVGLKQEMANVGIKTSFAAIIGWTVKWFFYIATFIAVVDILNISQLTVFLEKLAMYLPSVIVAIIILAVGLVVAKVLKKISVQALENMSVSHKIANFLGSLAKWAIFVFAFMAALVQLGVATNLIQILFTAFVFMIALAGGLAFGLGGRGHAGKVLNWIEKELNVNR